MNLLFKAFFLLIFVKTNCFIAQVNVIKDNRVNEKVTNKAQKQILGYRVQICFDSDKIHVDQVREKFINQ
jgi:LAS superfamily LD-carboxypeptidase LdcB